MKVIKVGANAQTRIAQACDRYVAPHEESVRAITTVPGLT